MSRPGPDVLLVSRFGAVGADAHIGPQALAAGALTPNVPVPSPYGGDGGAAVQTAISNHHTLHERPLTRHGRAMRVIYGVNGNIYA